jgi:hypothetical protein
LIELQAYLFANLFLLLQESFGDLAANYEEFIEPPLEQVLDSMSKHITASIADRVAVNKCVATKLAADGVIHEDSIHLNCNVHPLDSVSSKARAACKAQGLMGVSFGKDCAAANLLHNLSKMRHKQGTGNPVGFKAFLSKQEIPLKEFPRYVGIYCMHVVFHLAGLFILKCL